MKASDGCCVVVSSQGRADRRAWCEIEATTDLDAARDLRHGRIFPCDLQFLTLPMGGMLSVTARTPAEKRPTSRINPVKIPRKRVSRERSLFRWSAGRALGRALV
jgi:hypothetical protein